MDLDVGRCRDDVQHTVRDVLGLKLQSYQLNVYNPHITQITKSCTPHDVIVVRFVQTLLLLLRDHKSFVKLQVLQYKKQDWK